MGWFDYDILLMRDHCKKPDSVDAYRTYYIQEKKDLQSGLNEMSQNGLQRCIA